MFLFLKIFEKNFMIENRKKKARGLNRVKASREYQVEGDKGHAKTSNPNFKQKTNMFKAGLFVQFHLERV